MAHLTQAQLKEHLFYDPGTGVFTWVKPTMRRTKIGDVAGNFDPQLGYLRIGLFHKPYLTHRLAWLWTHGNFPPDEIDHINGNTTDNRIANLRLATHKENMENKTMYSNNTSGHRGVTWHKPNRKWVAQIGHNGVMYTIGYFVNKEDAIVATKFWRDTMFTHHRTIHAAH